MQPVAGGSRAAAVPLAQRTDRDDVVAVRKIINGGKNGLAECRVFLAKAKKALVNYEAAPVASILAEPDAEPESKRSTILLRSRRLRKNRRLTA